MSTELMPSMLVDWLNPGGNNPPRRFTRQTSTPMMCEPRWRKRVGRANRSGVLLLRVLARTKVRLEQALVRLRQRGKKKNNRDIYEEDYRRYSAPHGTS